MADKRKASSKNKKTEPSSKKHQPKAKKQKTVKRKRAIYARTIPKKQAWLQKIIKFTPRQDNILTLDSLPLEWYRHIVEFLDPESLGKLLSVSKSLHYILMKHFPELWKLGIVFNWHKQLACYFKTPEKLEIYAYDYGLRDLLGWIIRNEYKRLLEFMIDGKYNRSFNYFTLYHTVRMLQLSIDWDLLESKSIEINKEHIIEGSIHALKTRNTKYINFFFPKLDIKENPRNNNTMPNILEALGRSGCIDTINIWRQKLESSVDIIGCDEAIVKGAISVDDITIVQIYKDTMLKNPRYFYEESLKYQASKSVNYIEQIHTFTRDTIENIFDYFTKRFVVFHEYAISYLERRWNMSISVPCYKSYEMDAAAKQHIAYWESKHRNIV